MIKPLQSHAWPVWASLLTLLLGLGQARAQNTPAAASPATASPGAAAAPAARERAATVKLVNGPVLARGPQGERALSSGDEVAASERVLTGKGASVSLVLRDGSTLMLGPDSALDLKEFRFNPTTNEGSLVLSVLKGTLRMITGLIGKTRPESVRITTPTSTIGVLGTDFIVEVSEEVQP
ncbi:MAG: FecR domain-containing protein [Curvibacter lanceolatus]|uniref:FecR family protein n=1 Tax=Curvibacter lanceolatus TaxID=86182 RepID=UPI00037378CF|nr:FecR family protein [Curvibacter lanceolatus]MBV5296164.1 FecR domain-containing protein [Curvibacter lanceolatus]